MKAISSPHAATRGFQAALTANSIEILITETFQGGDTDFTAQLTRIRDANPEAIFISTLPQAMPLILNQGRQLGIPDSVPFILPELSIEQVRTAGDAGEGVITFTGWSSLAPTPGNEAFIQNYTEKYGMEPNAWAAQSYATLPDSRRGDRDSAIHRFGSYSRRVGEYHGYGHYFRPILFRCSRRCGLRSADTDCQRWRICSL